MPTNQPVDPNTITWDAPPQTVKPEGAAQGGVILTDPIAAAKEERAQAGEERAIEASQRAAEGNARERAKFEATGGGGTESQAKTAALLSRIKGGFADIQSIIAKAPEAQEPGIVETMRSNRLAPVGLGGIITREMSTPERRIVHDAQVDILDALLTLGTGAAYNQEQLEGQLASYFPQYGDTEAEIAVKNRRLRRQVEAAKIAAGPYADDLEKAIAPYLPDTEQPKPEQKPQISGSGDYYMTPQDKEMQAEIEGAYKAGATLEELQAISSKYGRTFPLQTQEELDKARKQGRGIVVGASGQRNAAQKMLGQAAETELGAYTVGAANGLLAGGLDELVGALGGDAEMAQAAKDYLRSQHPVSSFLGDVSGQAGQLALGGAGAKAAGLGAKAIGALEIAQGAAYGAGEANDNRGTGAALGALGAIGGQQLSKRLIEPAAQRIMQRIAQEQNVPVEAVEQIASDVLSRDAQTETANLAKQAIGTGSRAKKARQKLAVMAQADPEAKAAAERLGIDLPVDILSDDARLQSISGLGRSRIGSQAQGEWGKTISNAIAKSDAALEEIGATADIAQVGADVMTRMNDNIASLERSASGIRKEVTDAIDPRGRVDAENLQRVLGGIIEDYGGIGEARQAFSAEEKKLFDMLGDGEIAKMPTYARLNQVRDQIGEALFKGRGPWADTSHANLARYYSALADDQLAHIESIGGPELAEKMRASNELFSKMYQARSAMQNVFGAKLDKDLPPLINRAISSAQKGDASAMRKMLDSVPEEMRAPVLLSGLMAATTRKSANGGFSFSKYAQVYRGLRENSPIYKQIADTVGPSGVQVLNDLFAISRRMADGENKIIRTGASTQPMLEAMNTERLLSKLMKSTVRRSVVTGVSGGAGAMVGGPLGGATAAGVSEAMQEALTKGGRSNLDKLHELLSSQQFRDLIEKGAGGEATAGTTNRLAMSKPYNAFASKVLGLKSAGERRRWLDNLLRGAFAVSGPNAISGEQDQPAIEVR